MALVATKAFRRYRELFDEFMRQNAQGPISDTRFQQFEEAMAICRQGMAPDERDSFDKILEEARLARKVLDNQVSFTVDSSKAPYTVPCPVCNAYALDACRNKARSRIPGIRWPADARVLAEPHPERQTHWEKHPEWRVRAM